MTDQRPPAPGTCPADHELSAFLRGDLPLLALEKIGVHLAACPACDSTVRLLDASTDLTIPGFHEVFADPSVGPPPNDPDYQRMVDAAVQSFSVDLPRSTLTVLPTGRPPERLGVYQIGERIGRGGMGAVYRAEHTRLKRPVAVKVLPPDRMADPRAIARFEREWVVVGKLDHPNIVRATDAGEAEGVYYLVMDLVEGTDLAKLVRRSGALPVAEACELVRQAAVGLQHAHAHRLVHRDVKPSNLMLSFAGQVKVLDLGLALLRDGRPAHAGLSDSFQMMGTADYMAPEQWENSHGVDIRADVYSLGCTLFFLLTGQAPFTGPEYPSVVRKMNAHAHAAPPPVGVLRADIPAGVTAVLDRMLAKDPAARYQTPGELGDALRPYCAGADLPALGERTATFESAHAGQMSGRSTIDFANGMAASTPDYQPAAPAILATPAPAARRARPYRRAGIALLGLALAGGIGWAVAVVPKWGDAKKTDPSAGGEKPPRVFRANKWNNLLTAPPTEFHWWDSGKTASYTLRDNETLDVNADYPSLLSLGRSDTPEFTLKFSFRQRQWTGRLGVFFAGRPGQKSNTVEYQFVELRQNYGGAPFGLCRSDKATIEYGQANPDYDTPLAQSSPLGGLDPTRSYTLELQFTRQVGLRRVRWDGGVCPGIGDDRIKHAQPDGYTGEFGVYCRNCSVTVDAAEFLPNE